MSKILVSVVEDGRMAQTSEKAGLFCVVKKYTCVCGLRFCSFDFQKMNVFFYCQFLGIHLDTPKRDLMLRTGMFSCTFSVALLSFLPSPCNYQVTRCSVQVFPLLTTYSQVFFVGWLVRFQEFNKIKGKPIVLNCIIPYESCRLFSVSLISCMSFEMKIL